MVMLTLIGNVTMQRPDLFETTILYEGRPTRTENVKLFFIQRLFLFLVTHNCITENTIEVKGQTTRFSIQILLIKC